MVPYPLPSCWSPRRTNLARSRTLLSDGGGATFFCQSLSGCQQTIQFIVPPPALGWDVFKRFMKTISPNLNHQKNTFMRVSLVLELGLIDDDWDYHTERGIRWCGVRARPPWTINTWCHLGAMLPEERKEGEGFKPIGKQGKDECGRFQEFGWLEEVKYFN